MKKYLFVQGFCYGFYLKVQDKTKISLYNIRLVLYLTDVGEIMYVVMSLPLNCESNFAPGVSINLETKKVAGTSFSSTFLQTQYAPMDNSQFCLGKA